MFKYSAPFRPFFCCSSDHRNRVLFSYWAQPDHGLEISMYLNDHIAELCTQYPKKFIGLGTVPMQVRLRFLFMTLILPSVSRLGHKGVASMYSGLGHGRHSNWQPCQRVESRRL